MTCLSIDTSVSAVSTCTYVCTLMHGVSGYAHAVVCPCCPGRRWLHQRPAVPCGCHLAARCVWAVCVLKGLHHSHCILTRFKISCNSSEFALLTNATHTSRMSHETDRVVHWLPTAQDLDYCVTLYRLQVKEGGEMWSFWGKQRPHYKPITGEFVYMASFLPP